MKAKPWWCSPSTSIMCTHMIKWVFLTPHWPAFRDTYTEKELDKSKKSNIFFCKFSNKNSNTFKFVSSLLTLHSMVSRHSTYALNQYESVPACCLFNVHYIFFLPLSCCSFLFVPFSSFFSLLFPIFLSLPHFIRQSPVPPPIVSALFNIIFCMPVAFLCFLLIPSSLSFCPVPLFPLLFCRIPYPPCTLPFLSFRFCF